MRHIILISLLLATFLHASDVVKIGVLAKRSSDITHAEYKATAKYLTEEISGYKFVIVPIEFSQMKKIIGDKEVDFLITNTMDHVNLQYLYGVSRIATLKNINSDNTTTTSFGSAIILPKNSNIKTINDLKRKSIGAVDENSFGGWIMALKELKDHGVDKKSFKSLKFYGSHDKVVFAVRDGLIEAGIVRSDTLERMEKEELIDLECCKILQPKYYQQFSFAVTTKLYPEWPFSKLSHTSEKLSNDVLVALLKITPDSKMAKDAKIAGWTIPLDYSGVHDVMKELEVGVYAELGELNFSRFYNKYKFIFYTIIIVFLIVIGVVAYIYKLNKKLNENKKHIEALNIGLELKVQKRTVEIEKLYHHEKYLRNVLKTIADINELLISSLSIKSVIENSSTRLVKHDDYSFVWIGLLKNNLLEMSIRTKNINIPMVTKTYRLNDSLDCFALESVKKALLEKKTIVEKLPDVHEFSLEEDNYTCHNCHIATLIIQSSSQEEVLGTLTVFSEKEDGFKTQELQILENLATDLGLAISGIYQRSKLEFMELQKISNYEETILAFVHIIEQRDSYTAGHTLRVAKYCRLIAEGFNMQEDEIKKLEKAAILHDIGKVVTPDSILLKPGNLTALEYELIKEHATAGYKMLSKIKMYEDLAEIIRYHHVHYDGKGYPDIYPKTNKDIPFLSFIMCVADAFDAMTTNRIYKPRMSVEEALIEIERFSGGQFHPEVVKIALKTLKDVEVEDTTQLPVSELEQRRFAYFFMDWLTDTYNETYLQTFFNRLGQDYKTIYAIELKSFVLYNKKLGWKEGDRFLKELAGFLKSIYPTAMVFRYHGSNFVLLFKEIDIIPTKEDIEDFNLLKDSNLNIKVTQYKTTEELLKI